MKNTISKMKKKSLGGTKQMRYCRRKDQLI